MEKLSPVRKRGNDVLILVKLKPGARAERLLGLHEGRWSFAVNAPPVDGRANRALEKYLARILAVPPKRVSVEKGKTSRLKTVAVVEADVHEVGELLTAAARGAPRG